MAELLQYIPGNYVKFIRGTSSAWDKLAEENKSRDTLYFIADKGAKTGQLYMGNQLIAGGAALANSSIGDLSDIGLSTDLTTNSILIYDGSKWVDTKLSDLLNEYGFKVFEKATEEADGAFGFVPAPTKGQQNLFLRGDATWADPKDLLEDSLSDLSALQTTLSNLISEDEGKTIRGIVMEEINALKGSADEDYDTLEEIANWITGHKDVQDTANLSAKVENIEKLLNGENESTPGLLSEFEDFKNSVESCESDIENLNSVIFGNVQQNVQGLASRISSLEDAMKWTDMELTEGV